MRIGYYISKPFDLSQADVTGFHVSCENADDADVAIAVYYDGFWHNLYWQELPTQRLTASSLLREGTLVANLPAFGTVIPQLKKKDVSYAVAIKTYTSDVPVVNVSVNAHFHEVKLRRVDYSDEYDLSGEIATITADTDGYVELQASGYMNGRWLAYCDIDKLPVGCTKVKFKSISVVRYIGEEASFGSLEVIAKSSRNKTPSSTAHIYLANSGEDVTVSLVGNGKGDVQLFYCPPVKQVEKTIAFEGNTDEQTIELPETADFSTLKAVNSEGKITVDYDTEKHEVYVNSLSDGSITFMDGASEENWKPMYSDNGLIWHEADGKVKIQLTAEEGFVPKYYPKAGVYPLEAIEVKGAEYKNGVVTIPEDGTSITYTRAVERPELKGVILKRR